MVCLFLMVGISGSGKSTYAKNIKEKLENKGEQCIIVSTEDICKDLNSSNDTRLLPIKEVLDISYQKIEETLKAGIHCIFDHTNLSPDDRKHQISITKRHNIKTVAIVMNTRLTTAMNRNKERNYNMPGPIIWRQQGRFYPPTREEVDGIINVKE